MRPAENDGQAQAGEATRDDGEDEGPAEGDLGGTEQLGERLGVDVVQRRIDVRRHLVHLLGPLGVTAELAEAGVQDEDAGGQPAG